VAEPVYREGDRVVINGHGPGVIIGIKRAKDGLRYGIKLDREEFQWAVCHGTARLEREEAVSG